MTRTSLSPTVVVPSVPPEDVVCRWSYLRWEEFEALGEADRLACALRYARWSHDEARLAEPLDRRVLWPGLVALGVALVAWGGVLSGAASAGSWRGVVPLGFGIVLLGLACATFRSTYLVRLPDAPLEGLAALHAYEAWLRRRG